MLTSSAKCTSLKVHIGVTVNMSYCEEEGICWNFRPIIEREQVRDQERDKEKARKREREKKKVSGDISAAQEPGTSLY